MNRREVLEYLVQVLGVRDPHRLRRLAREYLAYQRRRAACWTVRPEPLRRGLIRP